MAKTGGSFWLFLLKNLSHLGLCSDIVMGHRYLFGTSQNYEREQDQNWDHIPTEQPYVHLGSAGSSENGFPVENISASGLTFPSQRNSAMISNEYPPSSVGMEVPQYRPPSGGSSYDPFLQQPPDNGNFCPASQYYVHQASPSSYYRSTIHGIEGSVVNSSASSSRRPCKRKGPATSLICERGSTSRYYGAGSSSDRSLSSDMHQEKHNLHSRHRAWDPAGINPGYRGSSLSIGNEGSLRNVRSQSSLDMEANLARTHLSSNVSRLPHSGRPVDHFGVVDLAGPGVNGVAWEWSHNPIPPTARGRILASDTSGPTRETNQFFGVSTTNGSLELGGYQNDFVPSRNPAVTPQNLHGNSTQSVRGARGCYYQRSSAPAYRSSSSYPHLGHNATSSEDGVQLASETYPARQSRSFSTVGWHNNDRSGRPRISYERFCVQPEAPDAHDRLLSEGLMIVENSALYGSRDLLDPHREMRLDIDSMGYEELLALGERIGSVNTGLSEDMISFSLTETTHRSSDQIHEEVSCAICLEEYKEKEEVGTLKNCKHDYHVDCIKKWLSMKNACPICKAPVIAEDGLQEK